MLCSGDRAGGGEGGNVGGAGGRMNETHFMDGYKDKDVISMAKRCLLLWPILIVGGAFYRKGAEKRVDVRGAEMSWSYGIDG